MSSSQIAQRPSTASQQPDSSLETAESSKEDHEQIGLFLAISHAAVQRQQESAQQREKQKQTDQQWIEEHVLKPRREQEEEEKERKERKEFRTEEFRRELEKRREERFRASAKNYFSRAEVDEEVRRIVEAVIQGEGMGRRRFEDGTEESFEDWRGRMMGLRKRINDLWTDNYERIRMGLPRYMEGYPVRERIRPPRFMDGTGLKMSGLKGCLQCEVKGLMCSWSVQAKGRTELRDRLCRRCEKDGDRCIVEFVLEIVEEGEGDGQEEGEGESRDEEPRDEQPEARQQGQAKEKEKKDLHIWDWWDGAPERELGTDSVAEALEMWERQRRGARLELVGGVMQWVEVGSFAPPSDDADDSDDDDDKKE